MKKILILVSVFFFISTSNAQKKIILPLNTSTGKIVWEGKVKNDSIKMEDIKAKLINWSSLNNYKITSMIEGSASVLIVMEGVFDYRKSSRKILKGTVKINTYVITNGFNFEINNVNITRHPLEFFYKDKKYDKSLYLAYFYVDYQMKKIKNSLLNILK